MSRKYKIKNREATYFLTMTVVGWIDIFTRQKYRDVLIENLKYCQKNKGLIIYAYVIMSNHVHMIAEAKEGFYLGDIIRDLKKYTAVKILEDLNIEYNRERKQFCRNRFRFSACYVYFKSGFGYFQSYSSFSYGRRADISGFDVYKIR